MKTVREAPWSSGERLSHGPWTWDQFPGSPKNQTDKIDHLMAEKNQNNKHGQKGQVTPKKKKKIKKTMKTVLAATIQ